MPSTTTMPLTTTKVIKKSQSAPTLTVSPASDKENPGSDTTNKQRDPKDITTEEMNQIFRESEEEVFKMSDEEIAKRFPWLSK